MGAIFVVGDLHFPFHHKKALKKAFNRLTEKKFDMVIQIGDLLDQYCFTRFPKKNIMLPEREIKFGRELAEDMWAEIRRIQPTARLIQILGNHDVRLIKRCEERLPEAQELVKSTLLELYRFEGVKTIEDPREEFFYNDIAFIHGHRSKNGDHTKFMHCNTVHGHRHRGEVTYMPIKGKILWELDVGYLADPAKDPMGYSPQRTTNWTLGHGEVDLQGPRFVPYDF